MTSHDDSIERGGRRAFLGTAAMGAAALAVGCAGEGAGPGADAGLASDGATPPIDGASPLDAASDAGSPDAGPPPVPPEDTPEASTFALGVASGDADETRIVCWTRHDGDAPLSLEVWLMEGETYARTIHAGPAERAEGGFVHVAVSGLVPGARHRYAFFELDGEARAARSPIGRFRAPLASTAREPLLIGAVSCTSNGRDKATLEHAGSRDDLDVFLCLGDTTYNDGSESLAEFREKWDESLGSAGWRATRQSTSLLCTWDDHEVDNDYDPERVDASVLQSATRTFFEHQPVARIADAPDRIWRSRRWGLTAELFVLDCRSERRPSTRSGSDPIYVSRAQMDWLKAGLAASPCTFKLILNSVPITDFPGVFDVLARDRWEGYAAQREEILRFIEDSALTGVLWISGDFHLASMGRIGATESAVGGTQIEVLAGPGAQGGNILAESLRAPQFDWASTTNNYTTFELEPALTRVRVRFHDSGGSVVQTGEYVLG